MPTFPRLIAQVLGALALGAMPLFAAAQLSIVIRGTGGNQIPIAVANFAGDPTPPTDIPQVVRDDLANSGIFRNIDAGANPISETVPIDFASWHSHGADALLTGTISHLADGRNDVRYRLYDTVKQMSPGGSDLTGSGANPRLTAHNIADFVYEKMTGVRGVFSTRIAYVIRTNQQHYQLQVADADGKNPQAALTSVDPIISPVWSPDGTRIAYVSFEKKKPIVYVRTLATRDQPAVANFKGSNSSPAWSPDGQTLAVVLTRDGNSQIYLMAADGSNVRRFTQSSGIDTEPTFSPDGASIYFTSDRGGGPQIYRASVSGGDPTRVTFSGDYNISPRISPDGKTLVYIGRRAGKFQVYALDLASSQEMLLTDTDKDESPSFSPNGKMILYATQVGGRGVLAEVSIDGAIRLRVGLDEAGDVREPAWGPFTK